MLEGLFVLNIGYCNTYSRAMLYMLYKAYYIEAYYIEQYSIVLLIKVCYFYCYPLYVMEGKFFQ